LTRYPLGLSYLAGEIKKSTDWDVMVYNADFDQRDELVTVRFMTGAGYWNYLKNLKDLDYIVWKEVQTVILEYRPSVIGITSQSSNFASAINIAKIAKRIDKNIIIIMGGHHPNLMGGKILENLEIDLCVRGEGEITIIELLRAIENNDINDTIAGISFRKNNAIIDNPKRGFIENLDDLCFPHQYAGEVLKDYNLYPKRAFISIIATRGCPNNCTFCSSRNLWGRRVRFRSPDNIVKEINSLRELGVQRIMFQDDTFGVNKKFIKDLCLEIKTKCHGIRWGCQTHVNLVDEENISLMKEAGCDYISLGVESGNDQILKEIRKNITIEEAQSAAKIIKKHGIRLSVNFMVGFPQETSKSLHDTLRAIRSINADSIVYSTFTPYPGTELFDLCRKNGLVKDDYDISLYNHQSPANCFYMNIPPEEFKMIVGKIEKTVDRKTMRYNIGRLSSKEGIEILLNQGLFESLRYFLNNVMMK